MDKTCLKRRITVGNPIQPIFAHERTASPCVHPVSTIPVFLGYDKEALSKPAYMIAGHRFRTTAPIGMGLREWVVNYTNRTLPTPQEGKKGPLVLPLRSSRSLNSLLSREPIIGRGNNLAPRETSRPPACSGSAHGRTEDNN
jgi:hypothetical protein